MIGELCLPRGLRRTLPHRHTPVRIISNSCWVQSATVCTLHSGISWTFECDREAGTKLTNIPGADIFMARFFYSMSLLHEPTQPTVAFSWLWPHDVNNFPSNFITSSFTSKRCEQGRYKRWTVDGALQPPWDLLLCPFSRFAPKLVSIYSGNSLSERILSRTKVEKYDKCNENCAVIRS